MADLDGKHKREFFDELTNILKKNIIDFQEKNILNEKIDVKYFKLFDNNSNFYDELDSLIDSSQFQQKNPNPNPKPKPKPKPNSTSTPSSPVVPNNASQENLLTTEHKTTDTEVIESENPENIVSRLGKVGTEEDLSKLREMLACFKPAYIVLLAKSLIPVMVARNSVANGSNVVRANHKGAINYDGVVDSLGSKVNLVVATSFKIDGNIYISSRTLFHEIGHAFTIAIAVEVENRNSNVTVNGQVKKSSSIDPRGLNSPFSNPQDEISKAIAKTGINIDDFVRVFQDEHKNFSDSYFHTPIEFFAETFSLYCLRPNELKANFPKTYVKYIGFFGNSLVDIDKLKEVEKSMRASAPLAFEGDNALLTTRQLLQYNSIREQKNQPKESFAFCVSGEEDAVVACYQQIAEEINLHNSGLLPSGLHEGYIDVQKHVDPKKIDEFFAGLAEKSGGALLYIENVDALKKDPAFIQLLKNFLERKPGHIHIAIKGDKSEREKFNQLFQEMIIYDFALKKLERDQLVERILQLASNDDFEFDEQALDELNKRIVEGGFFDDASDIWNHIRETAISRLHSKDATDMRSYSIIVDDLGQLKVRKVDDPFSIISNSLGWEPLKEKVAEIKALKILRKRFKEAGIEPPEERRFNFIMPGNPGTGKTTGARHFAKFLFNEKIVENDEFYEVSAADILENGLSWAIKEFEKAKDGAIFIDEFHQLDPEVNPKGREILQWLVPMLTNPKWEKTVFMCAGYKRELSDLMSADGGLRSRLEEVPFPDFNEEQLTKITRDEVNKKEYIISDQDLRLLYLEVERLQRSSPHPGNARDAVKTVERVVAAQGKRVVENIADIDTSELKTITEEDINSLNKKNVDEVWKEIRETLIGNEVLFDFLSSIEAQVNINLEKGRKPYHNIPMSIILEGGPGVGKTTAAKLIGKFYNALGILPNEILVEKAGGELVGGYIGNSTTLAVKEAYFEAYGGELFIDEISGALNAREFSNQAIKTMLTEIIDNPNTLTIVADYPHNIDRFLTMDGGLSRRFTKRLKLLSMDAEASKELMIKLTSEVEFELDEECIQLLNKHLPGICSLPQFASASDIIDLNKLIGINEASALVESRRDSSVARKTNSEILEESLKQLYQNINGRPIEEYMEVSHVDALYQQDAEAKVQDKNDVDREKTNLEDALEKVNKKYANLANSDDEAMKSLLDDANSEYYVDLGEELKADAAVAFQMLSERKKEMQQKQKTIELGFDYSCPFCGGTNNPGCAYFSNSEMFNPNQFRYDMDWLMTMSTKPPYPINNDK